MAQLDFDSADSLMLHAAAALSISLSATSTASLSVTTCTRSCAGHPADNVQMHWTTARCMVSFAAAWLIHKAHARANAWASADVGNCLQLINLICWLLPAASSISRLHVESCQWFTEIVNVCGVLRWTCWNTVCAGIEIATAATCAADHLGLPTCFENSALLFFHSNSYCTASLFLTDSLCA